MDGSVTLCYRHARGRILRASFSPICAQQPGTPAPPGTPPLPIPDPTAPPPYEDPPPPIPIPRPDQPPDVIDDPRLAAARRQAPEDSVNIRRLRLLCTENVWPRRPSGLFSAARLRPGPRTAARVGNPYRPGCSDRATSVSLSQQFPGSLREPGSEWSTAAGYKAVILFEKPVTTKNQTETRTRCRQCPGAGRRHRRAWGEWLTVNPRQVYPAPVAKTRQG
jgi:hypothetical protein